MTWPLSSHRSQLCKRADLFVYSPMRRREVYISVPKNSLEQTDPDLWDSEQASAGYRILSEDLAPLLTPVLFPFLLPRSLRNRCCLLHSIRWVQLF